MFAAFRAFFLLFIIVFFCLILSGKGINVGICARVEDGTSLLINKNSGVVMSPRNNEVMFDKLETGDRILIINDGIKESSPAVTGVYFYIKIGRGSFSEEQIRYLEWLKQNGWKIEGSDRV